MKRPIMSILAVVLSHWLVAAPAGAQDESEPEPVRCISLTRLERTEPLDERRILFHMRGGTIYLNELSVSCPGLDSGNPFMYRTTLNRICNVDVITVLERWGFGFTPAASCGLGVFHPITEEQAEALRQEAASGVPAEPAAIE